MPILKRKDAQLYYELKGTGEPVLFLQGIGVVGEGWRPQVDDLAKDHATLILDNRGIGRSLPCTGPITIEDMAQDALAVMDEVGWESAHVVGHSMGGVIAQQLALDAPKRVRSLSLFCTFGRGCDGARVTPAVLWISLRTRIGTRRMRRKAFLELLIPPSALQAADHDELAVRISALVGRDLADSPPILMKQLRALGRHNCLARLGELAGIPTLVANATHDPIALPKYGRMLAEAIPGARYQELADAAHGVTIEQAPLINRMLREFIGAARA